MHEERPGRVHLLGRFLRLVGAFDNLLADIVKPLGTHAHSMMDLVRSA